MLHWPSVLAVPDRPLALVGTPSTVAPVGVAHTNGATCLPEKIGPPMLWLVIFRNTPWPVPRSADSTLGPSASPVIRPMRRPSAPAVNRSLTSWAMSGLPGGPSVTWSAPAVAPGGSTISTSASPPLIMSARLDSVLISGTGCDGGTGPDGFEVLSQPAAASTAVATSHGQRGDGTDLSITGLLFVSVRYIHPGTALLLHRGRVSPPARRGSSIRGVGADAIPPLPRAVIGRAERSASFGAAPRPS